MNNQILNIARETLENEGNAILNHISFINESFVNAVELILASKGKVVVTGMG